MGLFKFVDFIGNQIDTLMDKMENSIDKFGNYLDNTIGKKLVVNQQYILSELSKQRKTIKDQSENDGKKFINNKSKPDNVTQFVDSKFDNEFKETQDYLGIQLPTTNTNTRILTDNDGNTNTYDDYEDYDDMLDKYDEGEYEEDEYYEDEDENQDFLNLILGD